MMGKEYTIEEFIKEYKDQPITFKSLFFKEVDRIQGRDKKLILLSDSILLKYSKDLESTIIKLQLSDREENKYFYNPKFLSHDLYGTTELWYLLLKINELYSTSQFSLNPLNVFNSSILSKIDTIMNLERPFIDENEELLYKEKLNMG